MDQSLTPWEPPLAGDELDHLVGSLERLRATFRWKADGLDASELHATIPSSSLTIGGLLKHLALVEDMTFSVKLTGANFEDPWSILNGDASDDWEFTSSRDDSPEDLYAYWDTAVARSRTRLVAALKSGGLDQEAHIASKAGVHASLRRLVFDLVEEYGRHTGHADSLREAIDGRVGEDPPPGWQPQS